MEYISQDNYKLELNGQEIVASAEDLRNLYLQIKKYEGNEVNTYVEDCPGSYIHEDSAKYELLRTEIKDDGYKNIKWCDELEQILDITIESAMNTAHNWYTSQYHMERKI